jgi:hypothetical protein
VHLRTEKSPKSFRQQQKTTYTINQPRHTKEAKHTKGKSIRTRTYVSRMRPKTNRELQGNRKPTGFTQPTAKRRTHTLLNPPNSWHAQQAGQPNPMTGGARNEEKRIPSV